MHQVIKLTRLFRDNYVSSELPGGITGTFKLKGKEYLRRDIQLVRRPTPPVLSHDWQNMYDILVSTASALV